MQKESSTMNKLLLVYAGAFLGFAVIGQVNDVSAQTKVNKSKVTGSSVVNRKVTGATTAKKLLKLG